METIISQLVKQFEDGTVTRRQLIQGLTAAALAAAGAGTAAARALEAKLKAMGQDVTITVHPGTGHAFMAGHNALGTHNAEAAAKIWPEVVAFLKKKLQ